jgi:DNA ligase-1
MRDVAAAIYAVGNVSGRLEKIRLLNYYANLPGFKEVLQFIYNPYVRTGIAKAKLNKGKHSNSGGLSLYDAIKHFTKYHTGSDSDVYVAWTFINHQHDELSHNLAIAIVTKDLQIGITSTTLNNVYGDDFIPKIGLMLGHKYPEYKNRVKGPYVVTEKLDGHRRILVKDSGTISVYSRTGIPDEGLVDIEYEAQVLPDNMVYDGECLAIGTFKDSIEQRIATSSIMSKKGVKHGVTFNVFDAVPVTEFKAGRSHDTATTRKVFIGALFKDKSISNITPLSKQFINELGIEYDFRFIKPVPILGIANTEQEILDFAMPIWKRGLEGVMLNTFNGLYEIKRTKELLKVKHTEEYELKIVDTVEGEGKFEGMLGSLIVNYRGYRVGIGSGFDDSQRQKFWDNRDSLIGKYAEIDSFGESKNQDGGISLNCPIFKRIVGDQE